MKICKAITNQGIQCKNRAIPSSKYCYAHQDVSSWVLGTILGMLLALVIAYFQYREPSISVQCYTDTEGNPAKLFCSVKNDGRGEANDIYISFSGHIPIDIAIAGPSEAGLKIIEAALPLESYKNPELLKYRTAFAVYLPHVAPNDVIEFSVYTTNEKNIQTAKDIIHFREAVFRLLKIFENRLKIEHPEELSGWNYELMKSMQIKKGNFFSPTKFSYKRGRFVLDLVTEEEIRAALNGNAIIRKYMREYSDIYKMPELMLPVLVIKTTDGVGLSGGTYSILPSTEFIIPRELTKFGYK